jgi:hypothetical protein
MTDDEYDDPWDEEPFENTLQEQLTAMRREVMETVAALRRSHVPVGVRRRFERSGPRRCGKPAPTFTPRLISKGTECARIDRYGSDCDEPGEVALTLICRSCGPVHAQICLECFDEVVYDLTEDGEGLLCTSETPGRHEIVHLTEAVFSVDADA